ncbi:MAG: hypothetical protein K8I00_01540 [Candidatus Omnitrophica bacterium]|nr:hypothetical protein [Candidatus Omnitrophota bacterium]
MTVEVTLGQAYASFSASGLTQMAGKRKARPMLSIGQAYLSGHSEL